jgi:hypothetical protein
MTSVNFLQIMLLITALDGSIIGKKYCSTEVCSNAAAHKRVSFAADSLLDPSGPGAARGPFTV